MAELTIKERILKALLESPKTTGNLAIELGYVDEKGYGKYNFIKADLNTLEEDYRFIHRIEQQKKNPGKPPTTYDIVYKISVIRDIWDKYPELKIDLQNSYSVVEIIRDSVLGKKRVEELTHPLEFSDNLFYGELAEWFSLSPSFFEYCLKNDRETIMKHWKDFFILNSTHGLDGHFMVNEEGKRTLRRDEGTDKKAAEGAFYYTIEKIYEHCVSEDVLNGRSNPEAVEEIRNKRKERIEKSKVLNELSIQEHNREMLNSIYLQTLFETSDVINHNIILDEWTPYQEFIKKQEQRGKSMYMSFGQMEEDGKISLMSNEEKIEYFKNMGVPITEKLAKKYNIYVT